MNGLDSSIDENSQVIDGMFVLFVFIPGFPARL